MLQDTKWCDKTSISPNFALILLRSLKGLLSCIRGSPVDEAVVRLSSPMGGRENAVIDMLLAGMFAHKDPARLQLEVSIVNSVST